MSVKELKIEDFYRKITDARSGEDVKERIISIPTNTIGALRKELIGTIGEERTKGFLLRYGWHAGAVDAQKILQLGWESEEDVIEAGPKMHMLHGWTEDIEVLVNDIDMANKKLYLEALWKKSYESQEFINFFGRSDHAVCNTMMGYASGYLSTILGTQVIVIEDKCEAKGDHFCHCICRTVEDWGDGIAGELKYYETDNIIKELNVTYDELRQERDNLKKAFHVHETLMKEVNSSNDIHSIIKMLHQITSRPAMLVGKYDHDMMAASGLDENMIDIKRIIGRKNSKRNKGTKLIQHNHCQILMTPIHVQNYVMGYCCLVFDNDAAPTELDRMILERGSLACSVILLNEKTSLDTKQKVGGSLLEEILAGNISNEEINRRAFYLGFEKLSPFFIVSMDIQSPSFTDKVEINELVANEIYYYFKNSRGGKAVLIEQRAGKIVFLCTEDTTLKGDRQKQNLIKEIMKHCQQRFHDHTFQVGISSVSDSLQEISCIYKESLAALKVTNKEIPIVSFETLGVEGLLFQLDEDNMIDKLIEKRLGKLLREDKDLELTKTLCYYLKNGCNLHQTARDMNFSISGLRYRIQQINQILETKVNSPEMSYQLFLAIKALTLLGRLDIDIDMDAFAD